MIFAAHDITPPFCRIKNCDYGRPCLNFIADFHIDFELVRNGQIKFGSGAEFNHAVYFSPFDLFAWLDGAYDASGDSGLDICLTAMGKEF